MDDDVISKLPDALIQQILSFLPLDEAVRTSILSKRWEFLWTSFPNLKFDLFCKEDIEFVYRALFLRESRAQKFSICFHHRVSRLHCALLLRKWITDIISLHVEDIHLEFCFSRGSIELPHCLFTCGSLTSFRLFVGWNEFTFPPSINLSNLKNLVLQHVYFEDEESVDNLFNGCPMLETASLLQCAFEDDCCISAPKLYKLVVDEPDRLRRVPPIPNVMVFGPSLKSFRLRGLVSNFYCLNDQPLLDEAEISVQYRLDKSYWIYKLLKCLAPVKKLSLSSQALEALSYQGNRLIEVPIFNNLSILSFVSYGSIRLDLGDHYIGLMKILYNSPCLKTLRFETGIILDSYRTLDPVPTCLLSSLKTLEILFENDDDFPELLFMDAAKLLLERASVLEKLILYPSKPLGVYPMDKEKLIKGLSKLPRASKVCQFEFSDFKMKSI